MWAVGGGLSFAIFILFFAPKLLAPIARIAEREGDVGFTFLAIVLILFLLSAFFMDFAGIHAVFGGFLLGTAMPRGKFALQLKDKIESFIVVFLLPMFFTYSGLYTQLLIVIITTLMASPLFERVYGRAARARGNL